MHLKCLVVLLLGRVVYQLLRSAQLLNHHKKICFKTVDLHSTIFYYSAIVVTFCWSSILLILEHLGYVT